MFINIMCRKTCTLSSFRAGLTDRGIGSSPEITTLGVVVINLSRWIIVKSVLLAVLLIKNIYK